MPSALSTTELTTVLMENLPAALDNAVATINPLWSQTRAPGNEAMPVIQRRPASSALGPFRKVAAIGNTSGAGFTPGGALNAPSSVQHVDFQQGWGAYQAAFALVHSEKVAIESGALTVDNWLMSQLDGCAESIARSMAADVFTGNATDRIDGLSTKAISDSVTYGGISRVTYPSFQCYVDAPGARNLTTAILEAGWDTARTTKDLLEGSWFGLTDSYQFARLRALTDRVAINNTDSTLRMIGQSAIMLFGRIPVFLDPNAVAGEILFMRAESLAWELKGNVAFHVLNPQESGDITTWHVIPYPQLVLSNPGKSAFRLDDLNN